ncbi:MAG TPA: FAD-dependent oxidoreductase [Jiangellaceae bacterium]|nr:FAD-dependent oxidoreductase [Jiangellaceae bacterium]
MASTDLDAVVVGAGVIGLTTAVCLAEAGLRVTVVTADPPERTTSMAAGAIVGPVFVARSDPGGVREHDTFDEFTRLASVPGTGVRISTGRFAAMAGGPDAPPIHRPTDIVPLGPDELPAPFTSGFRASVPCVDMPRYLEYLSLRLTEAGGTIEIRRFRSLAEMASLASLVANCPGVGARELVPDPSVRPVRGQHVIVENPGLDTFFIEAPFGPSWTSFFPYGGHVVLGGIAVEDDWSLEPDLEIAEQILARCVTVEPRLAGARVIGHRVGLRPARPEVRLEVEELDGSRIVHDYGHGGSGVALSWGCAREASALLTGTAL